jgi:hypothetical protein
MLFRAFVRPPVPPGAPARDERIVFFDTTRPTDPAGDLERQLAEAWGETTVDWSRSGAIAVVESHARLVEIGTSADPTLRVLETGIGGDGPYAVGPERIHYARAGDVDVLVDGAARAKLEAALATVESLYAREAAMRRLNGG